MCGRHAACDNTYHVHEPEWVLEVSTHSILSLFSRVNNSSDVCRWWCCCLSVASSALMRRSECALTVFKVTACLLPYLNLPILRKSRLGLKADQTVVWVVTPCGLIVIFSFRRNRLPPSSGTLLPSFQATRCHDAADHTVVIHGVNHHRPPAVSC
jgi:hypothetical protein